jgi:hypothetical protein
MDAPEAPNRQALMLVRFVAGCVMIVGLLEVGLYLTKCFLAKPPLPVQVLPIVTDSIPLITGIVIFVKAKAIANWVADKLE